MAIYVDQRGNEYIKNDAGHYRQLGQKEFKSFVGVILTPFWKDEDGVWHSFETSWRRPSRTSCIDDEWPFQEEVVCSTRAKAKEMAVKESARRFRTIAILGGY